MFEGIHKKPFRYIHCWYMLRNEVKWTTWLSNAEVHHAKVVPNETDTRNVDVDNVSSPSDPFCRPPGGTEPKKLVAGTLP
jgi:hypothetical protein